MPTKQLHLSAPACVAATHIVHKGAPIMFLVLVHLYETTRLN